MDADAGISESRNKTVAAFLLVTPLREVPNVN